MDIRIGSDPNGTNQQSRLNSYPCSIRSLSDFELVTCLTAGTEPEGARRTTRKVLFGSAGRRGGGPRSFGVLSRRAFGILENHPENVLQSMREPGNLSRRYSWSQESGTICGSASHAGERHRNQGNGNSIERPKPSGLLRGFVSRPIRGQLLDRSHDVVLGSDHRLRRQFRLGSGVAGASHFCRSSRPIYQSC